MSDLTGRVALVTGGGRDVGAEICRALAAAGAKVAVNYNASKAEAQAVAVLKEAKIGGKPVLLLSGCLVWLAVILSGMGLAPGYCNRSHS